MAGGREAAPDACMLHPWRWPVRWEGEIAQAPPALPVLDATLHYHGDAQVGVEEAAFARRQPVPIPMDRQWPGLVVLGGPHLVLRDQRREPHEKAARNALDVDDGSLHLCEPDIAAAGERGKPRMLQTPRRSVHPQRPKPHLAKSCRPRAIASLVHQRKP